LDLEDQWYLLHQCTGLDPVYLRAGAPVAPVVTLRTLSAGRTGGSLRALRTHATSTIGAKTSAVEMPDVLFVLPPATNNLQPIAAAAASARGVGSSAAANQLFVIGS